MNGKKLGATMGLLSDKRFATIVFMICVACVFSGIVFLIPPSHMTDPAVRLLTSLVWPFTLLFGVVFFRSQIDVLIMEIANRIKQGDDLTVWNLLAIKSGTVSDKAARLPTPSSEEPVTLSNIALLHTSFIPKKKPAFNDGLVYLQIEIIVIAPDSVMDRIASVTYRFEDSYPKESREQVRSNRQDRFKVKELANGTSIVRAEVKFMDQETPIHLNRFIDLRPDGPRL